MTARAETVEQRFATYRALNARNRIVTILRLGLPALGLLVFLIFTLQIFVASLASQFGIGKVSFSGDTVTVDTPSYSGVMANGDIYKVSAQDASTPISDLNTIDMRNPTLLLTRPDGTTMTARAGTGAFETLTQVMTVPGTADIMDSEGNAGTLDGVTVSLPEQTLVATGHALINLAGGGTIDAQGLHYDARTSVWDFGPSTVTLPGTPGGDSSADASEPSP